MFYLYKLLFEVKRPDLVEGQDWQATLRSASLATETDANAEPSLSTVVGGMHDQFERKGFSFVGPVGSKPDALNFHRRVSLKASSSAPGRSFVYKRKPAKLIKARRKQRTLRRRRRWTIVCFR